MWTVHCAACREHLEIPLYVIVDNILEDRVEMAEIGLQGLTGAYYCDTCVDNDVCGECN